MPAASEISDPWSFSCPMAARSFATTLTTAEDIARTLADAKSAVPSASGGVIFVSGALTQQVGRVAEQVRAAWRGVPACVVPGAGVLTERGEIEGATAASGVLWAGGSTAPFAISELGEGSEAALGEAIAEAAGGRRATALVFARPEAFKTEHLEELGKGSALQVFGAGTVGGAAVVVTAEGKLLEAPIAGLVLKGLAPPIADASPACKLLSQFERIDEAAGGMVARVGGRPALDMLSALTAELPRQQGQQPLVFAALAFEEPDAEGRERYVVRPVRGIDPARKSVLIGREARPGVRFAFGVRDAAAARAGLQDMARAVAQQALGAAPRFAIYLSCAGRGQGLYGTADVEARILRQRFGDLPIAGMHSAFEIAPGGPGQARLALYTGVLALFRSPS
jgi:small ligand-binding sensory domain FIST